MIEPHVTVGLSVCNDADGLRRTVPTMVGQTWRGPLRLVVVDDGSTDETTAVLESRSSRYSGIEVVRNHTTVGPPRALNTPKGSYGAVVNLGSLVGDAGPVTGVVVARPSARSEIVMRLNGEPLLRTYAGPGRAAEARFSLACQDLLAYLGDGDVLTVDFDGEPLPLGGYGSQIRFAAGYRSRSDELLKLLANGYVFTKLGALRKGHTPQSKRAVLDLFGDVASLIATVSSSTAFLCYGNLLGTIREHDFISHDVGGFDMAYLSEHGDPAEVRREFTRLCRELVGKGYAVTVWPWGMYVRRHRAAREFVDVSFAWLNEAGELRISFGTRHHLVTDRERVLYPRQGHLAGRLVPVPGTPRKSPAHLWSGLGCARPGLQLGGRA